MSAIFAAENWFLIIAAVIWIIVAIVQDFRKREVANWWNFSLIIIALAYRAFLSLAQANYWYVLWGVIGLAAGFVLANLFYYARMFAGGDAKLLISLGAVLPLSLDWSVNLKIGIWFLILFLFAGGIYGGIYSIFLALFQKKKFSKEFGKQFKKYKAMVLLVMGIAVIIGVSSSVIGIWLVLWLSILLFFAPVLLIYAKAIEEVCMIKLVKPVNLTIGDWLVKDVKIGNKKVKPNWQGLSEKELVLIQKKVQKKVLIRYGIPFTPSFLIAFIGVLIMFKYFSSIMTLW